MAVAKAGTAVRAVAWTAQVAQAVAMGACLVMAAASAMAAPSVFPTGVTRYDPARAYNSYVLFSGQDKRTHLIDMNGNEVRQWPHEGLSLIHI